MRKIITTYVPELGDIVWLDFCLADDADHCTAGPVGRTPVFIVSSRAFHERLNIALAAPVLSCNNSPKHDIKLPSRMYTRGLVDVCQLTFLDYLHQDIELIERSPRDVAEGVKAVVANLLRRGSLNLNGSRALWSDVFDGFTF